MPLPAFSLGAELSRPALACVKAPFAEDPCLGADSVLIETAGKKRDRWYSYQRYFERLRVGTDLDVQRRARSAERQPLR